MTNYLNICIPSYKRAGVVTIFNCIPKSFRENVFLYVRKEEYEEYSALYSDRCTIVPIEGVTNIGETRQKIVEHQKGNLILMIDDDLSLHDAYVNESGMLRARPSISEDSFYKLMEYIDELCGVGFLHGGFLFAAFPRTPVEYPYRVNSASACAVYLDLRSLPLELVDYRDWPVSEDAFVWLNLISHGYDFAKISKWMLKQPKAKPNTKLAQGGCWDTRNAENIATTQQRLLTLFPDYFRVMPMQRDPIHYGDGSVEHTKQQRVSVSKRKHVERMKKINPNYTWGVVHRPEYPPPK